MLTATVNALRNTQRIDLQLPIEPDQVVDREMKQVIRRVVERELDAAAVGAIAEEEASPVKFAEQFGFTKFLYRYQKDGHEVVVDVMDPSRTDGEPN